jgi:branched-chain amino acid transport system substrate-binding protein
MSRRVALVFVASSLFYCQQLIGIPDNRTLADGGVVVEPPDSGTSDAGGCTSNAQCAVQGSTHVCIKSRGQCVDLKSLDCQTLRGEVQSDDAILIGALFAIGSPDGSVGVVNTARLNSALLAVDEINQVGGVPATREGNRPLGLVGCDALNNLDRAARHLTDELGIQAIVGPNLSQDTLDVTTRVTKKAGVLIISPAALAPDISALDDDDLTWRMVPSDAQRAQLLISRVNAIENDLRDAGVAQTKISVLYRSDILGRGTFDSLAPLMVNGAGFNQPANEPFVKKSSFEAATVDLSALAASTAAFEPQIIVVSGTSDSIDRLIVPIEAKWNAASRRPLYVTIDPLRSSQLLNAASASDAGLRGRISGTGFARFEETDPIYDQFVASYQSKFTNGGPIPTATGMAQSHDAVYAIAFAISAQRDLPITGANIAKGMRRLASTGEPIAAQRSNLLNIMNRLGRGELVNAVGTFGPFDWDSNGDIIGSKVELWCVGTQNGKAAFLPSGLAFNTKTKALVGTYKPCQ